MKIYNRWNRTLAALGLAGAAMAAAAAAGCQAPAQQRQLTVLLVEYRGPDAAAEAKGRAQELTDHGIPDVFVVQGGGLAGICAGHFDSWRSPRADEALRRIRRIQDEGGQYPFAGAMLVPIPEPMPENPWPLEKADGYFTLQVASWEAPGRMPRAQAYAAELRRQGYEAYVYHGPRLSMVSIGAFGPEIFDNPALVSLPPTRPGQKMPKPKIVDPKVNELIAKFPHMRLEGEDTWDGKHLPTQLVIVPGRDPGTRVIPKALYRVALWMVDTHTGLADERGHSEGVAQSKGEISVLVEGLVKQMMAVLPADRVVHIGIVAIGPTDGASARERADAAVLDALVPALGRVAARKAVVIGLEETSQILDAAGKSPNQVLANPRTVRGIQGLDLVVIGTVTAFTTKAPTREATPGSPTGGFSVNP